MKRILLVVTVLAALSASVFAQKNDGTCAAFPCVVTSVSLANQSQAIPATPLFTSSTGGVFRVNTYISTTHSTNKNAFWQAFENWTDNIGPRKGGFTDGISDEAFGLASVLQLPSAQTVTYQVRGQGGSSGGMTYDLTIVVEQLQ